MTDAPREGAPARAPFVLTSLILAALVCNINLAAANIALPDIGDAFGADQTQLNLVALGCSLGLAMSVLYLGAVADRYGRKQQKRKRILQAAGEIQKRRKLQDIERQKRGGASDAQPYRRGVPGQNNQIQ